jgi:hypothetical protein
MRFSVEGPSAQDHHGVKAGVTMDPIRDELQRILDEWGDGWSVSHYAVIVGIERMTGDSVESTAYVHAPDSQARYVTSGLLLDGAKSLNDVDDEDG